MKTYALPIALILSAAALLAVVFFMNINNTDASVAYGNDYDAYVISTTGTSTIKTIAGTIGSVVIPDAGSAGVISFYATSSVTSTSTADLVFTIDGAAAEGTYTFDVGFGHGLLVDHQAFNGTAIVTYR